MTGITRVTQNQRQSLSLNCLSHAFDDIHAALGQIHDGWVTGDIDAIEAARVRIIAEPTQLGRMTVDTFGLFVAKPELALRERLAALREVLARKADR